MAPIRTKIMVMRRTDGGSGCGSPGFSKPMDRGKRALLETTTLRWKLHAEEVSPGNPAEPRVRIGAGARESKGTRSAWHRESRSRADLVPVYPLRKVGQRRRCKGLFITSS